jgi:hypothetical protein
MTNYLNESGVPLSVAVYLATDHYDHNPNTVSATKLLKPVRQIILPRRVPQELNSVDVLSMLKSRTGTSIHDGIERAWVGGHYKQAMVKLGHPQSVVDRIVVNSKELLESYGYDERSLEDLPMYTGELPKHPIPVFMEVRGYRDFMGKTISGKFDFCGDGRLEDTKTTGVFTWIYGSKTEDYQLQGSIYRWLHPKIITQDEMAIQFIFTDWKAFEAKTNKNYPPRATEQQIIPLLSLDDTEQFIANKLSVIEQFIDADEESIPRCTDSELWRKPPVYKYYRDPAAFHAGKRSTKNFDTSAEAFARLQKDGNKGVVIERPGEVVACKYCSAFPVCTQKDDYLADGSLRLD